MSKLGWKWRFPARAATLKHSVFKSEQKKEEEKGQREWMMKLTYEKVQLMEEDKQDKVFQRLFLPCETLNMHTHTAETFVFITCVCKRDRDILHNPITPALLPVYYHTTVTQFTRVKAAFIMCVKVLPPHLFLMNS